MSIARILASECSDAFEMQTDDAKRQLTPRQKLALARRAVVPESILATDDNEINNAFLSRHGISATNIRSSGLLPLGLRHRGVADATALRTLGFDAIDLNDASFCASSISAFGADDVTRSFILTAGDAVAIAGSTAVMQLGVTAQKLLEACAGAPVQAKSVVQQMEPRGGALRGVDMRVILDSGLRAQTLCALGYSADSLREQTTMCTDRELRLLGF